MDVKNKDLNEKKDKIYKYLNNEVVTVEEYFKR